LINFYAKASPADLRLRFFMSRRGVSHSELARYSQIYYDCEMTFIVLVTSQLGEQTMAVETWVVCEPDNMQAEFAILAVSGWQGEGLGHVLLSKLTRYLRERVTTEVEGQFWWRTLPWQP
jgi:acetyltransferase